MHPTANGTGEIVDARGQIVSQRREAYTSLLRKEEEDVDESGGVGTRSTPPHIKYSFKMLVLRTVLIFLLSGI